MSWHGVEGHDEVVDWFRHALGRGRLASSFLFVGPAGIGKRTFALKLAQSLLCRVRPEADMDPCGACQSCVQVTALSHPDLQVVSKPAEKSVIPVELLVGDREHRMQAGLCHNLALKPFLAGRKVALIDDADYLNLEGANCLLKTLEEPPPRSVLILIGTSPAKQLPTIRSRCQQVRFRPLAPDVVARLLVQRGWVDDARLAQRLAAHSQGSVARALELTDPDFWAFRTRLLETLASPQWDARRLAASVNEFVAQAEQDAPARRRRLHQLVAQATEFYRQLLSALTRPIPSTDQELERWVHQAAASWSGDALSAAACVERCLEASTHIDRNAYQPTLVDCWLHDLSQLARGSRVRCS